MNDQQFDKFMDLFDQRLEVALKVQTEQITEKVKEDIESRFQDIEGKIDWLIGAVDTDENERLALGFGFDRKFNDHERRIRKLELATE